MHTVEVAVLDEAGNGTLYLRDLQFEPKDRFYVGIADLTVSESRTSGPAELLQGDNPSYDFDSTLDGRLAFYLTEKFARSLARDGERRYARRTGERPVQQLPGQVAGLAVPPHRS